MSVYRWDKRRARKDKLNLRPSLDVFDLVLLSLIFTIGVVLFKFLMVYAIITMPCADYAANFGVGFANPPAFKIMFYISILMLGFLLTLVICEPRRRNSIPNIIWQFVLLLCILLMGHSSFHMSIWGKSAFPDGTIAVANGIWGTKNGERVWSSIPLNPQIYELVGGGIGIDQEYRAQRCVWLNDGLVSVGKDPLVGELDGFIEEIRQKWVTGELNSHPIYPEWPVISGAEYIDIFLYKKSQIETLRQNSEFLRPLSNAERERFLAKQKCLQENAYDPSSGTSPRPYSALIEKCDPRIYPAWPIQ